MLHSPASETKRTSGSTAAPLREVEAHPHLGSPFASPAAQRRNRVATWQNAYGNQAVMRTLERSRSAGVLQRQCACDRESPASSQADLQDRLHALTQMELTCPAVAGTASDLQQQAAPDSFILGLTKIQKFGVCLPEFTVNPGAGSCKVKAHIASQSLTSKFVPANPKTPTPLTKYNSSCTPSDVPVVLNITKNDEKTIQAGEQEHCDDHSRIFDLTLKPCQDALQKVEGQDFPGKTERECLNFFIKTIGFDPKACTAEYIDLSNNKSKQRDVKNWHTYVTDYWDPKFNTCSEIRANIKKHADNRIGDSSVAPANFIPASTKCPGTAVKAPKAAAQPTPPSQPAPAQPTPKDAPVPPKPLQPVAPPKRSQNE
jgi:hypothetical protein